MVGLMVHTKRKSNGHPFRMTTRSWGIHKYSKNPEKRKLQKEIVDLLYSAKSYNGNTPKDHEVLTITVLQKKNPHFQFLKAHTRWGAVGSWVNEEKGHKFMDEKNSIIQVEFLDTHNEALGRRLMQLFDDYNKKYVKEDSLYVRTHPIEESSLPLMEWR